MRRAAQADPEYPDAERPGLDEATRRGFWMGLRKDGLVFSNGELVTSDAAEPESVPPYAHRMAPPTSGPASLLAQAPTPENTTMSQADQNRVFVVHGRDEGSKHEVARFLEKLRLTPIILHEQPNGGRTLIAKFQGESASTKFAVVIMTPDDAGGGVGEPPKPRARQNVIFELGFFVGKLGTKNVCVLVSGDIERPSDFEGVVYISYGPKTEWKTELARELHSAGINFDPGRLL